jgi:hypothetical protein
MVSEYGTYPGMVSLDNATRKTQTVIIYEIEMNDTWNHIISQIEELNYCCVKQVLRVWGWADTRGCVHPNCRKYLKESTKVDAEYNLPTWVPKTRVYMTERRIK